MNWFTPIYRRNRSEFRVQVDRNWRFNKMWGNTGWNTRITCVSADLKIRADHTDIWSLGKFLLRAGTNHENTSLYGIQRRCGCAGKRRSPMVKLISGSYKSAVACSGHPSSPTPVAILCSRSAASGTSRGQRNW